ncbi:ribonucleoside-diphosphate reductase subunit alpha [Actinosynnema sp. NPDC047251]|uniref:Ribonucleoside-diphosphate reductase n=1 Tax=Saccharothrix espanaensis (strain ATCC 51144 / DSM 44229 / JCM 9112 / NBRC 15066 / NRRL 15764) TaxID=1179773 RepID=K0K6K3_SACES|nr:ribonucleoside-diphosphate reductase subunit alpha [Saccharothrix espanaensis]CCH32193.1 Ribonucleoside-diphosphate reductase [Saccharothrix espanaensis DSM 44229]
MSTTTTATGVSQVRVIRRDGSVSAFDPGKIQVALTKAFLAVEGEVAAAASHLHPLVAELTSQAEGALLKHARPDTALHIEQIQDQVELVLMRGGHHKVARAYVLYRDEHAKARELAPVAVEFRMKDAEGALVPVDWERIAVVVGEACAGLSDVPAEPVLTEVRRALYDGITVDELAVALVMSARTLVETEPNYSFVAARLLLDQLRREVLTRVAGRPVEATAEQLSYVDYFPEYVRLGVALDRLDPALESFDVARIAAAIRPERDAMFDFLGMQTLYDRYFLHDHGVRYELPQAFFMRVAMGLALREDDREARAIEFYELLSAFDFMCSTPTLFNSGTTRAQLSSCFLTTVDDDLKSIFQSYQNNALLAKFSGGLGNDWTPVRGMGAHIKGTNGQSQGVVPFLKIANDTAVAVNQGGKRKGAACAYLETWHIDVEEFLDLRKNTGDDRRRTHDMNTANWVPDEFLRRVEADAEWTLFSPDETPDLHDAYGLDFTARYRGYEEAADRGEIRVFKRVRATDLWRRMLTMLFETGHPWITFKDPCNLRSPQQHTGVVHSSNLCTEITLNTSADEVAVCNLGSVNLANHVTAHGLDAERLAHTVHTAVRMLDNVIDINYYTIPEASRSNLRHRPIGLGLMGFSDALFTLRLVPGSPEAVEFADRSMEHIGYHALSASADLARERGSYESFDGSLWSRGVLPIDSIALLAEARGGVLAMDTSSTLDWETLRAKVRGGMRNSNTMAIAPTATISNICGVGQSIEPLFRNLYVKSNMSGDFTVLNRFLVADLKALDLWDEAMVSDLKYFDGSVAPIDRVPDDLKALYATAFEVSSEWLIEAASRRQKWIDQAQSLNLYIAAPNGRKLDNLYRLAWHSGLKTTYYLRSTAATSVEKSTLRGTDGKLNAVRPGAAPAASPVPTPVASPSPAAVPSAVPPPVPAATPDDALVCSVTDPDCEACQ